MYVRLVMSVVLFSVGVALGDDCHSSGMLRQQYTRLLWSVHVHMVSTLYHILTSSFSRVTDCLYSSEQGMPYRAN